MLNLLFVVLGVVEHLVLALGRERALGYYCRNPADPEHDVMGLINYPVRRFNSGMR